MTQETMQRDPVAVFGLGGIGYVIASQLVRCGDRVVSLDDDMARRNRADRLGVTLVGGKEKLEDPRFLRRHDLIVGIGDNEIREKFCLIAVSHGARLSTFIHPDASVDSGISLGEGLIIMANASISSSAVIGTGTIVNICSKVPHDVVVGRFSNLCDGSSFGGGVVIGDRVLIGMNAVVLPKLRIGDDALIGPGTVVTRDVPAGAVVVGNPGRIIRMKEANGRDYSGGSAAFPETKGGVVVPIGQGS